jgi:hypothetical protein
MPDVPIHKNICWLWSDGVFRAGLVVFNHYTLGARDTTLRAWDQVFGAWPEHWMTGS